jgi:hypothetical protein
VSFSGIILVHCSKSKVMKKSSNKKTTDRSKEVLSSKHSVDTKLHEQKASYKNSDGAGVGGKIPGNSKSGTTLGHR